MRIFEYRMNFKLMSMKRIFVTRSSAATKDLEFHGKHDYRTFSLQDVRNSYRSTTVFLSCRHHCWQGFRPTKPWHEPTAAWYKRFSQIITDYPVFPHVNIDSGSSFKQYTNKNRPFASDWISNICQFERSMFNRTIRQSIDHITHQSLPLGGSS